MNCKACGEKLIYKKIKDDENAWWCEMCRDINAEPEDG
jgi:hypothetical protein